MSLIGSEVGKATSRFAGVVGASLLFLSRHGPIRFEGNYSTWESALARTEGYDDAVILDRVLQASRKVRDEVGWFERDGVLFSSPQWNFPLVACLLKVATVEGLSLSVLDVGGSLGSTYFQSRAFLAGVSGLSWRIVEQAHFVERGRAEFESDALRFFPTIQDALADGTTDVALLSGVLPYVRDPDGMIAQLAEAKIRWLIVDRTPTFAGVRHRLVIQHVQASIYGQSVRYPAWILSHDRLHEAISRTWPIAVQTDALDGSMMAGRDRVDFRFVFAGPSNAHASEAAG